MRKIILYGILLLGFSACKNEPISDIVTEGVWKIHFYQDSGKDETSDFTNYTFEFKSNGQFVAQFTGQTKTGTWREDNSSEKLIIDISGTKQLDDVSDDWYIIKKSATLIELKDDKDKNDDTEIIHFKKM
jgi:hypothetical protein